MQTEGWGSVLKLDAYREIAGELQELYHDEVMITLFDTEKVIAYYPGPNMKANIQVGQPIPKGSNGDVALRTGKKVIRRMSKEMFGIPYVGIAWPIRDNGQIVGAIAIAASTERYDVLLTSGQDILAAVEEIAAASQNLSAGSEELAATVKQMSEETERVKAEVLHTNAVTDKIKKISMQSNILGLNAAVEAARAGEHGRGFAVVADEVRKLADNTKNSTVEIEADLNQVKASVNALLEAVGQLAAVTESQATSAAELSNAINQIARMAERLVQLGQGQS